MRFKEFSEITLDEVSMAPGKLKALASSIKGICGIEFELLVPNVKLDDDAEEDFEHEDIPTPYSIEDVIDFFSNDYRSTQELRGILEEKYQDYVENAVSYDWNREEEETVRSYIVSYEWDEDKKYDIAYDELGLSDKEKEAAESARNSGKSSTDPDGFINFQKAEQKVEEMLDEFVEECISKQLAPYNRAREDWMDSYEWPDEHDFLRSSGLSTMQRIYNEFEVTWPFKKSEGGIDDMVYDFKQAIGKDAVACTAYHSCEHYKGKTYVIEPDSSVAASGGFAGLEIVSPALPLDEMIPDLNAVINWAKNYGCETNKSCGLHMNISIENVDLDDLDYVKLALFLGDLHILSQFERMTNTFCKSAIKNIQQEIAQSPDNALQALDTLQQSLTSVAGELIHKNETTKYTSINVKDNRIEFRSPGGDWLDIDVKTLENTLYRFIVALDIACDSSKYPQEYAKKLYKLVNPEGSKVTAATLFSNYQAGVFNLADLKQHMRTLKNPAVQQPTKGEQPVQQPAKKSDTSYWIVTGPNNVTGSYAADTQQGAINKMRSHLKLNSIRYPNNVFTVEPSSQTDIFTTFGDNK